MKFCTSITSFLGLVFISLLNEVKCTSPTLTLYSGKNYTGESLTVTKQIFNLEDYNFDDLTKSVCGSGLWILYEDPEFTQKSEFIYEFVGGEFGCEELATSDANMISSVRYPGTDDIYESSLTLYYDHFMANAEFLVLRDESYLFDFDDEATSFAVIGNSSWTLYADPDYEGNSFCLVPGQYDGYYYGLWEPEDVPLDNDVVSSVAKGCFSPTVLQYESKKGLKHKNKF